MIGRLVRCKNNNKVGIVLHREITRRGNFRYHVFMGGEIVSMIPQMLEVIDAER
jgi:hypothetical protein